MTRICIFSHVDGIQAVFFTWLKVLLAFCLRSHHV